MNMLKTLNGIGIFKNDDVWFPTYYTYNTMWNFTDASSRLAQVIISVPNHVVEYVIHVLSSEITYALSWKQ